MDGLISAFMVLSIIVIIVAVVVQEINTWYYHRMMNHLIRDSNDFNRQHKTGQ
jgi:hypothetical protein